MTEQPSTPPEQPRVEFSLQSMKDSEVYGLQENGIDYCIQLMSTWNRTGTFIQSLRNIAKNQDRRIKELLKQNEDLKIVNADLADRLDNLRANHRKVIAAQVETQMADLGLLAPQQSLSNKESL